MAKCDNNEKPDQSDSYIDSEAIFGKRDLFSEIGLGFGASDRARELVVKGLIYEFKMHFDVLEHLQKPKRGAPKKHGLNIDVLRAAAVLSADDLWRERKGKGFSTQKEAIDFAKQIDRAEEKMGLSNKRLFRPMTSQKRLQDSVSAGLKELGLSHRFSK